MDRVGQSWTELDRVGQSWTGGMTSHAAVVARGMGRPCVAGAGSITVDYAAAKLSVGSVTVTEGQILTIDGSTGEVMVGEVPTALWPKMAEDSERFFRLASGVSVMQLFGLCLVESILLNT